MIYNAKLNIHWRGASPIYLGLQDSDLTKFEKQANVEELSLGPFDSTEPPGASRNAAT